MSRIGSVLLVAFAVLLAGRDATADDVQVAVAANFAAPMRRIADDFAKASGHHALVSVGATGTLYAQIEAGAPFEVFLAADEATPKKLEASGLAVAGSRFVYAKGTLVLWSAKPGYVDAAGDVLKRGAFQHLAVANAKLAPYGAAALEVLGALGLADAVRPKLLVGESIAQAYQFVATGNAELGFVALSQVAAPGAPAAGSTWVVPPNLYTPIAQDAVLLRKGAPSAAAQALCGYLKGPAARDVIRSYGYAVTP